MRPVKDKPIRLGGRSQPEHTQQQHERRFALQDRVRELEKQLARANKIIGWMMPYIGTMCPPKNGLFDLNEHCFENKIPEPGMGTKCRPINHWLEDPPPAPPPPDKILKR